MFFEPCTLAHNFLWAVDNPLPVGVYTLIESTQHVTRPLITWQLDGGWAKRQLSSERSQRCLINSRQTSTERRSDWTESIPRRRRSESTVITSLSNTKYALSESIDHQYLANQFLWHMHIYNICNRPQEHTIRKLLKRLEEISGNFPTHNPSW